MQRRPAGLRTDDLDWTREIAAVFGPTIPGHFEEIGCGVTPLGPAMSSVLIEYSPTWLINHMSRSTSQARDCWLRGPAERRWPLFAPLPTAIAETIAILCSAYGFNPSCHDMGEQAMENAVGYRAMGVKRLPIIDETLWYLVT